jgi:hypothetical protein
MEKIDKSLQKEYSPLVLYVDALEDIIGILSSACSKVKIQTDDYKFDSISELKDYFKDCQPKSLKIESSSPYCTLELNSLQARLYIGSSNTESAGIFYKINDILVKSQRRPNFTYSYYFVALAPNVIYLVNTFIPKYISDTILFLAIQLSVYAWTIWVLFIIVKKRSTITLESAIHKQGFFKKYSDRIKLSIIVAVTTTVINFACQELIKKLWPSENKANTSEIHNLQK